MLNFIDNLLNRITMYRLVLYYLIFLITAAIVLSLVGVLAFSAVSLIYSVLFITALCYLVNTIFAWVFEVPPNVESIYITALILVLIITPMASLADTGYFIFIGWAAVWAMASKYILAIKRKHIFNPAAFAVALTSLTIGHSASWWVGTAAMLPFVMLGGVLVVRKIQRWDLVLSFFVFALAAIFVTSNLQAGVGNVLWRVFTDTPLLFFAFIMLTEPLTTPPTRAGRTAYGVLTGVLFAPNINLAGFYFTPELALLAGNIFSYFISPKNKYLLKLQAKIRTGLDTADFIFFPDKALSFRPGQYLEWTLAHNNNDNRGNRRYFTLASSPTEHQVRLGVKFYPQASSFKRALIALNSGETMLAGQLAGDFVLPKNKNKKLAFIAGGIGITPFRSMIKYLIDKNERRDAVLFYSNKTADEINYKDVFDRAEAQLGIKTIYTLTDAKELPQDWQGYSGKISSSLISKEVPDYKQRIFYISGPRSMVTTFEDTLKLMGVPRRHIKVDFFPGFA